MSVIFPGNWVAHLNAYRGQGCYSIPGVEFYRYIGVAEVTENVTGTNVDLELKILSPDLRQDDKPRIDKPFVIPQGAGVYRTAVNSANLVGVGAGTLTVQGVTPAAVSTAVGGEFPADGGVTEFDGLADITRLGSDTTVSVRSSAALTIDNSGSAAIGSSQSAVIVEVDFFMDAPAPDLDDTHLPYKVVAGQGT